MCIFFLSETPPHTFQMFVLYLFHQMCWKIDCYPLLKSTVLINIGNSFCIPLSLPFKWSNCIPEVALFSGCYWSPCFLTQISHYPYLPPSQEHTRVHTKTHMLMMHIHSMKVSKLIGFLHADYMKKQNKNTKHLTWGRNNRFCSQKQIHKHLYYHRSSAVLQSPANLPGWSR